jgi:hypothetical protein
MKRWLGTGAIVLGALAFAPTGQANVLFDFQNGAQGWGSFGPLTTDSGPLPDGSVGQGRFHSMDFALPGWGIVDVSPVVDLTLYTGMGVDARLRNVPGYPDFGGTPEMEFMIAIGYAEWFQRVTLTNSYQTFSVDFVDLMPNYYASVAPYFGALPALNSPGLQIKLVMRHGTNTGVAEMDYDQVTGIPEPATLALVALGLVSLGRRRAH